MKTFKTELYKVSFTEHHERKIVRITKLEGYQKGEVWGYFYAPAIASFLFERKNEFSRAEAVKVMAKATEYLF